MKMILGIYIVLFILMIVALKSRYYIFFKGLNSLAFVVIAVYGAMNNHQMSVLYIMLPGLIGCMIGDIILAMKHENHFFHGLVAFLIANLCFLWYFSHFKGLMLQEFILPVFSIVILISLSYLPKMNYGELEKPIYIYTFVIAWATSCSALVYLAMPTSFFLGNMMGFGLYLLSDLILLFYEFYETKYKNILGFMNLLCYYSGLFMIAYSFLI